MLFLIDEFLNTYCHNTLFAIRSVIGHDDKFVAALAHFVFKDYKVLATSGYYRQHTVASSLQCTDNGKHRSYANATASTYYCTEVFYVSRIAKRTYNVGYIIAFIKAAQFCR